MDFFGIAVTFLGTVAAPLTLFLASAGILSSVGLRRMFRFSLFFRGSDRENGETSPWRALSLALAGTLGVGNITGVASALMAGGPGAVFWMWAGAVLAIPVKYAEVRLAVRYRRKNREGYYGGAPYTILSGFGQKAKGLAAGFAVLCVLNALITGNLVQSEAAVGIFGGDGRMLRGMILCLLVALSVLFGAKRIEKIAGFLMPWLTGLYILVCMAAVLPHLSLLPGIVKTIVVSAFSPRAFGGGMAGFGMREAMRYGILRGILSNEAGCGTSPTAHAASDTDSEEKQAMLGVFEVIFDTLILCTLTAFVLLTADGTCGFLPWRGHEDASGVAMKAFGILSGVWVERAVRCATFLFAYASIIAQIYYGTGALRFLTEGAERGKRRRLAEKSFIVLSILTPAVSAMFSSESVFLAADFLLGTMTVVNCLCLFLLRKTLRPFSPLRSPSS